MEIDFKKNSDTTSLDTACYYFRQICQQIGILIGNLQFKGSFAQVTEFYAHESYQTKKGMHLAVALTGCKKLCSYQAKKLGIINWLDRCWGVEIIISSSSSDSSSSIISSSSSSEIDVSVYKNIYIAFGLFPQEWRQFNINTTIPTYYKIQTLNADGQVVDKPLQDGIHKPIIFVSLSSDTVIEKFFNKISEIRKNTPYGTTVNKTLTAEQLNIDTRTELTYGNLTDPDGWKIFNSDNFWQIRSPGDFEQWEGPMLDFGGQNTDYPHQTTYGLMGWNDGYFDGEPNCKSAIAQAGYVESYNEYDISKFSISVFRFDENNMFIVNLPPIYFNEYIDIQIPYAYNNKVEYNYNDQTNNIIFKVSDWERSAYYITVEIKQKTIGLTRGIILVKLIQFNN